MQRIKLLMASVLMLMTLSACNESGRILPPDLPRPSAEVVACIQKTVPLPKKVTSLSKIEVLDLIGKFRKNDVAKTQCGNRVLVQTNETLDAVEAYIKGLK